MNRRRARLLPAALAVGLLMAAGVSAPASAAEPTFGQPTSSFRYLDHIEFRQPVVTTEAPARVEILLSYPDEPGPDVVEVDPGRTGSKTMTHRIDIDDGHLLPNTAITARWRITDGDGTVTLGPETTIVYSDTTFTWRTLAGDLVRVHWYEGDDAFGRRALEIGERAIREISDVLGVEETEPVDFFVYADRDAFYDALGPSTRENVGGQANPGIRTLFALIGPGQIGDAWVGIVIPHELSHLVFDLAVDNPYHYPPRWLNEGVAVYLSQGYEQSDRSSVQAAVRAGDLIALDGLTAQFPTSRDRFFLAYAESVAAVDFLVREHGRDALVSLVRSYADGLSDDEAFSRAIGMDARAFNDAWFADLGAQPATVHGPQPAPVGPLPSGWEGPAPQPSVVPGAPSPQATPTGPGPSPGVPADPNRPLVLVAGTVVVFLLVGLFALLARRRTERGR